MSDTTDVLFVHNEPISYRSPFFCGLSNRFDTRFLFTDAQATTETLSATALRTYFGVALGLVPVLLRDSYDVVIVGGWSDGPEFLEGVLCLLVSSLRRKRRIVWLEHWYPPIDDPKRLLAAPVIRMVVFLSHAHVVPGQKSKELCRRMGASESEIFVAPNASQVKEGSEVDVREELGLQDERIILYFSRIVPYKGLNYLIRAYAAVESKYDDVFLLVCGKGDFRSDCEQLCGRLGIDRVQFTGYVPEEQKYAYFDAADVFVLPTAFVDGHAEAWGLVLNEAMATGTPVVSTTAVAGAYDLIEDGRNGYVVEEKDVEELSRAIDRIIRDPETALEMGSESNRIVNARFTYDHMVEGFADAIEAVHRPKSD